jgi:hypothetical protein
VSVNKELSDGFLKPGVAKVHQLRGESGPGPDVGNVTVGKKGDWRPLNTGHLPGIVAERKPVADSEGGHQQPSHSISDLRVNRNSDFSPELGSGVSPGGISPGPRPALHAVPTAASAQLHTMKNAGFSTLWRIAQLPGDAWPPDTVRAERRSGLGRGCAASPVCLDVIDKYGIWVMVPAAQLL